MNKQQLVSAIAEKHDVSLKDATTMLDIVIDAIKEGLIEGEPVKVPEFGVFTVKTRKSRKGVVPGTTKEVLVPEKKSVSFRTSKKLKERL